MERILVAVDGYGPSLGAVKKAVDLADKYNAELICLQVEEKTPMLPVEKSYESVKNTSMIIQQPLQLVETYANNIGVAVRTIQTEGVVAGTIIKTASNLRVELIVIGDSARKGVEKLHFGSVAESVLKRSAVPVLVIKNGTVDIIDLIKLAAELENKCPIKIAKNADAVSVNLLQQIWSRNFLLSFGFLGIFSLFYFTTAAINTPTLQTVAAQSIVGIPLGVWLLFTIFPFSLVLCWFYIRMGR